MTPPPAAHDEPRPGRGWVDRAHPAPSQPADGRVHTRRATATAGRHPGDRPADGAARVPPDVSPFAGAAPFAAGHGQRVVGFVPALERGQCRLDAASAAIAYGGGVREFDQQPHRRRAWRKSGTTGRAVATARVSDTSRWWRPLRCARSGQSTVATCGRAAGADPLSPAAVRGARRRCRPAARCGRATALVLLCRRHRRRCAVGSGARGGCAAVR